MKLSAIFGRLLLSNIWGHFSRGNFSLDIIFVLVTRPLEVKKHDKIRLKHFKCAFLIENCCLNCLIIVKIKDHKEFHIIFLLFFDRKIHKKVRMIRRRLFFQLSEAQSTGLWWRQRSLETAAWWRCVLLINDLTTHYNSQFCEDLNFWSGITQMTINGSNKGLTSDERD